MTPVHACSFPTRRSSDLLDEDAAADPLDLEAVQVARILQRQQPDIALSAKDTLRIVVVAGCDDHLDELLRYGLRRDRKSTRLNSSHANISYAVCCLKKKN